MGVMQKLRRAVGRDNRVGPLEAEMVFEGPILAWGQEQISASERRGFLSRFWKRIRNAFSKHSRQSRRARYASNIDVDSDMVCAFPVDEFSGMTDTSMTRSAEEVYDMFCTTKDELSPLVVRQSRGGRAKTRFRVAKVPNLDIIYEEEELATGELVDVVQDMDLDVLSLDSFDTIREGITLEALELVIE